MMKMNYWLSITGGALLKPFLPLQKNLIVPQNLKRSKKEQQKQHILFQKTMSNCLPPKKIFLAESSNELFHNNLGCQQRNVN